MITTVIFDMNGVIIDDEPLHELAFQKTCHDLGINLSHQNYKDLCMGRTDKEGFKMIAEKFSMADSDIKGLVEKKSLEYLGLLPGPAKSYPNVLTAIKNLSKCFTLALTSSSSKDEIDMVTITYKIKDFFKILVSADDIKNGKPHPEPYLITAKRLREKPENCLVIEDSKNGVLSAKEAGMKCIAITTTHTRKDLEKADIIIENFSELTGQLIKNINNKQQSI